MSEKEALRMFAVCSLLFLAALASAPARAAEWNVYNVSQLNTAVNDAGIGDIITVHPGTYNLTSSLWMDTRDVTLRGATGNPADVILWGGGMNNTAAVREGVQLAAPDITVKDLTIEGFYHHGIHFQPAGEAEDGSAFGTVRYEDESYLRRRVTERRHCEPGPLSRLESGRKKNVRRTSGG